MKEEILNVYSAALMALIAPLTLCLGAASAQSQPRAAIVTGEVHNPSSREIGFRHEPLLAPGPSEHHIVLDEQNRFALLLNISKGVLVTGIYKGEQYFLIPFFVEPGDSLHAVVTFAEVTEADSAAAVEPDSLDTTKEEPPPAYSLTFSGWGADNNRFLAEFWPQHNAFDPDNGLEAEAFTRRIAQRRRDEFALLAGGRENHALSAGFIDYMTTFFNYKWAGQMISYPMFALRDGHWVRRFNVKPSERRAVPPDYYDFLQEIPLIDEKAIGVTRVSHWFVENTLDMEAKSDRPSRLADRYKLSGLGLSESVHARLDSMYRANSPPRLSQMIDLAEVGLAEETYAQLDSMYRNAGRVKASEKTAWLGLELSPAAQAELDSYKDYITAYSREDTVKIDTTGGELTLHIPSAKLKEWHEYRNNRPAIGAD